MARRGRMKARRGGRSPFPRGAALALGAAFCLAALCALGPRAARAAGEPVAAPGCSTAHIVLGPHQLIFRLPHPFLRPGSDSAWTSAGAWRRGVDYVIEPTRGELRLLRAPAAGETLQVRFCRLLAPPPLLVQGRFYRPVAAPGETVAAGAQPVPAPRPATAREGAGTGASLQLSGNKSVAVDFGTSQDAFLRQSLDLTVSGRLSPDVELAGVITDRNTPLGAAGATQDLQALDRVLLELRAPHGGAALGDISLEITEGEFARLARRLQGARAAWGGERFGAQAAASTTQGEFHTLQFFGQEGLQGPYRLTDRSGRAGVAVVPLSEVVHLDGERLSRGESADYAMDYERGEITFTNRRPVSSASRITVDYQFTLDRFRRNLAAGGARASLGGLRVFSQFITEGDDRGSPIGLPLGAEDRVVLAAAGDSSELALAPGVDPGPGDYDLVAAGAQAYYAFAGLDSGDYAVSFAFVGAGRGDYADSTRVAGRAVYRFVGAGSGDHRVGRRLPLPDSHQLWSLGLGWQGHGLLLQGEGAASRMDRNTLSAEDDGDNLGKAGSLRAAWEKAPGGAAGRWLAALGVEAGYRAVDAAFQPFTRLEAPFANEDWGLPTGTDLDRQERLRVGAFARPRPGGELRGELSRLRLPSGFDALRRSAEWRQDATLATRARWERVEAEQPALRFASGGREKRQAEARLRLRWGEPAVRADWDERRAPSDTGRAGDRYRLLAEELRAPASGPVVVVLGHELRHDDRIAAGRFEERFAARTVRLGVDAAGAGGALLSLGWQRRDRLPRAEPGRVRSDLGHSRLQWATADRRVQTQWGLEVTSEAQSVRRRNLRFVGPGLGAYDSLGNPVGRGDYELTLVIGPETERVSRGSSSARVQWQWGGGPWRGSRTALDLESESRRRGDLVGSGLALIPSRVAGATGFSLASALLRLDQEVAPDSPLGGLRLLLEHRASADRSFADFLQELDTRQGSLRWRARPGAEWTLEAEGRLKREAALQDVTAGARLERVLAERAAAMTVARVSGGRYRAAGLADGTWSRPEGGATTRVLRLGAEAWLAWGERSRLEATGRHAWLGGESPVSLLPSAQPALFSRWEGSLRADYRIPPGTHASASVTGRTREGRSAEVTGRLELRVFF